MAHDHGRALGNRGRLLLVLALSLTIFVVQLVVGVLTGSLALLSDAAHVLSDSVGVLMALAAITIAQRPTSDRRTFGLHRSEVLAAGANGLFLVGLFIAIAVTAIGRLADPPELDARLVLAAGAVGLLVNLVGVVLLREPASHNLNMRGAYLEVLGDALGSVAVVISAALILLADWHRADPIASLVIAALIVPRAISLLRDVGEVLLEATPRGMDLDELRDHILGVEGVIDVHDLHVWAITSGMPVMSAHVVVGSEVQTMEDSHVILDRLSECLVDHFDVEHSTFQLEPEGHRNAESHALH